MPQHFHRLFFVLQIELKTLFLKVSFDVFECEKNPWTYFLKIFYVKNIYFEKNSGF